MQDLTSIGFTRKTHGIAGEISLKVEEHFIEDLLQTEVVFLGIQGKPIPYFVEGIRFTDKLLLKLEEIDSKELAQELVSKEIFLRTEDMLPEEQRQIMTDSLQYADLLDYTIIDDVAGKIGTIEAIEEFPQQEMAALTYEGREILIPLNEQLILQIDAKAKEVHMQLPTGLLQL